MTLRRTLPVLAALGLVLSGCGGGDQPAGDAGTPSSSSSAPAEPPLDASPTASSASTATSNGEWTLTVAEDGRSWRLEGPGAAEGAAVSRGFRITDALLSERWAVIVQQDRAEERPQRATVLALGTGQRSVIDGSSAVPTARGGLWAIDGDRLVHATERGQEYCLAWHDLAAGTATKGWCAPGMDGFNYANLSPAGDAMLTFTSGRPSCRTVVELEQAAVTPFADVPECSGSEGALLDDGAVWSVVPDEQQYERVRFFARSGSAYYDLGAGTNQTLTTCGHAAYFTRDSDAADGTATLLRWDGSTLAVVYESKPGQAFLDAPRCGGDHITVSSFSEGGDEQVTAPVS